MAKSRLSETEGSQTVLGTCRLRPPQQGLGAMEKGEASSPGCQGDAEASDCPGGPVAQHRAFSVQPIKVFLFILTWFSWILVLLCCLFKKKTHGLTS